MDLITNLQDLVIIEWLLCSKSGIFGVKCTGDDELYLCVMPVVVTTSKCKQSGIFSSE